MQIKRIFLATLLVGSLAACVAEPTQEFSVERSSVNGLPSVLATNKLTSQVKVVAIDYDDRSIALEGSDGQAEIFKVPAAVRNFTQIKKGDLVNATYEETVNVNVRKVGKPLAANETLGIASAPLGDKPAVVAVRTVETLANVQAIDYDTRTVTLVGISNKPVTFTVSPKLKDFDKVSKGDQVIFTYTEAVTIEVAQ